MLTKISIRRNSELTIGIRPQQEGVSDTNSVVEVQVKLHTTGMQKNSRKTVVSCCIELLFSDNIVLYNDFPANNQTCLSATFVFVILCK